MKLFTRARQTSELPGITGTVRLQRRRGRPIPNLRPGDVAVIDQLDLDRDSAQAFVDAGVVAVLDASEMISGRYPNLGPQVLADAGIVAIDALGTEALAKLKDGDTVRLDGNTVHADAGDLEGRLLDDQAVSLLMEEARSGLGAQLGHFTHNSTEFLRREQDLLLHGHGVPELRDAEDTRPSVVVVRSGDWERQMRGMRAFIKEKRPRLIAVDNAAEELLRRKSRPDVVVLSGPDVELLRPEQLKKTPLVVVIVPHGAPRSITEPLERLGIRAVRLETTASAEDAALLIAAASASELIVGVGMFATLDDFLDRSRPGLASTFLTRLKIGPRLLDASAVPTLYDGAVRPRHVGLVSLFGAALVAVAVSVTPVGQEWASDLAPLLGDISDYARGLFE